MVFFEAGRGGGGGTWHLEAPRRAKAPGLNSFGVGMFEGSGVKGSTQCSMGAGSWETVQAADAHDVVRLMQQSHVLSLAGWAVEGCKCIS